VGSTGAVAAAVAPAVGAGGADVATGASDVGGALVGGSEVGRAWKVAAGAAAVAAGGLVATAGASVDSAGRVVGAVVAAGAAVETGAAEVGAAVTGVRGSRVGVGDGVVGLGEGEVVGVPVAVAVGMARTAAVSTARALIRS